MGHRVINLFPAKSSLSGTISPAPANCIRAALCGEIIAKCAWNTTSHAITQKEGAICQWWGPRHTERRRPILHQERMRVGWGGTTEVWLYAVIKGPSIISPAVVTGRTWLMSWSPTWELPKVSDIWTVYAFWINFSREELMWASWLFPADLAKKWIQIVTQANSHLQVTNIALSSTP